jgi:hypothetical protein
MNRRGFRSMLPVALFAVKGALDTGGHLGLYFGTLSK